VFRVLVLSALLHVSSDVDGLLDQAVDVFWDFWSGTFMISGNRYRSSSRV